VMSIRIPFRRRPAARTIDTQGERERERCFHVVFGSIVNVNTALTLGLSVLGKFLFKDWPEILGDLLIRELPLQVIHFFF